MDTQGKPDREALLGRVWDALQDSGALGSSDVEAEDLEVITKLHGAEDVPSPNDETIQRMWIAVDAGVLASSLPSANGQVVNSQQSAAVASNRTVGEGTITNGRFRLGSGALQRAIRTVAVAVVAGFIVGFLVLGGGGRLAMRLAAMMSADELQGATTENLETVGEMTLSGTLSLMITGGWFGIALGLGFVLIAPLLPSAGWKRVVTSGAVFFAVCGFVTLEGGENRDYERFGIAGVNVCLFTLLPLLFGLLIDPVFRQVDRRLPRPALTTRSVLRVALSIAMGLSLILAFFGFMFLLILPPLQLFLVAPLLALAGRWVSDRWGDNQERWMPWVRRIALAGPGIAGLTLTLVAIGRIV